MNPESPEDRWNLVILLSLLVVIILHPILQDAMLGRLILATFVLLPLTISTLRLSQKRHWVWPSAFLYVIISTVGAVDAFRPTKLLTVTLFILLSVYVTLVIAASFSYLRSAKTVTARHLYAGGSTYLLLGLLWYCVYSVFEILAPGSFVHNTSGAHARGADLLYFSLVTLTTVGYGDISPMSGTVRMLSAVEAVTGVLYVAITVAVLVGSYKLQEK
jgi:voltage-gated potassium channel